MPLVVATGWPFWVRVAGRCLTTVKGFASRRQRLLRRVVALRLGCRSAPVGRPLTVGPGPARPVVNRSAPEAPPRSSDGLGADPGASAASEGSSAGQGPPERRSRGTQTAPRCVYRATARPGSGAGGGRGARRAGGERGRRPGRGEGRRRARAAAGARGGPEASAGGGRGAGRAGGERGRRPGRGEGRGTG
jgi:hypothetical protein